MTQNKHTVPLTLQLLQTCRAIELACSELYFFYALSYGEPELRELWHKTALEERNHAAQFDLLQRLPGAATEGTVDLYRANSTLSKVRSILDGVKTHLPAAAEALSSAIRLEHHLAEFHAECVAVFTEPSLQKIFHAMLGADQGHIERLETFRAALTSA